MNRREALRLTAALVGGVSIGKLLSVGPELESNDVVHITAADLARMEASANRSRYPRTWPLLAYTGAIQLNREQIAFYGVGRPCEAQADRERIAAWQGDAALDVGVTDCGRAWCIVSRGVLSAGCRREQHQASAERDHGQRVLELYVRRADHRKRLSG